MDALLRTICHEQQFQLLSYASVHGGDINYAFRLETNRGSFFLKLNEAEVYPGMLIAEAKGLATLSETNSFVIPRVISKGETGGKQWLLMEWMERGQPAQGFWEQFGQSLAALHQHSQRTFGLQFDNYIGSLPQANPMEDSFATFYANHRVWPLVQNLIKSGVFDNQQGELFWALCRKLREIIPTEPPALLHGDLWAGNYLVHEKALPVLIDPAPYYGHREMDIAMTRLFGEFDQKMYEAYQHFYPLQKGWLERIPLFQLYPLLVHAVLFGGGYTSKCVEIAKNYV